MRQLLGTVIPRRDVPSRVGRIVSLGIFVLLCSERVEGVGRICSSRDSSSEIQCVPGKEAVVAILNGYFSEWPTSATLYARPRLITRALRTTRSIAVA